MATAPKAGSRPAAGGLLRPQNLPVVLTIAAMVVGIAALLPLVQSSESTSTAGDIRQLEQDKTSWQIRLQELEVDIARMGSLDWIEAQARFRFKMGPPQDTMYISVDSAPPEARRIPSRFLPQEQTTEPESTTSVWEDLFGWLPLPWD